jgi:hypothetical protein
MKTTLIALTVLALAGCATTPISQSQARQAPASRLFAYQTPMGKDDGTLIVVRDKGALGSGCRNIVYIDGKESALLSSSEKATFYVAAGRHLLGNAPSGNGLCGGKTSLNRTIAIDVVAGHTSTFRLAILGDGGGTLMPTSL